MLNTEVLIWLISKITYTFVEIPRFSTGFSFFFSSTFVTSGWGSHHLFGLSISPAHGDVHPQARWEQYEDHTAQRPAMAHSTRLAERNITLQHLMKTYARERIRGVRGLALFDLIKQEVF